MKSKAKKVGLFIVGAVGFLSALIGLWDYIFPPTPDSKLWLMPKDSQNILFNQAHLPEGDMIEANEITIDGVKVTLRNGSVLVANIINLINGAEIFGDSITLIATRIEGGRISSTRARNDKHGGDIFVTAAIINGTSIESNGAIGRNGRDGEDGQNGARGSNGRNGSCKGFGGWKKAQPGDNGANGGNGKPGKEGMDGADGQDRSPTIKLIDFSMVQKAVEDNRNDKSSLLSAIRAIRPSGR